MDEPTVESGNLTGTWDSYQITFDYYQQYLDKKGLDRFVLSFTDLLYASNYKGGNGSIQEHSSSLMPKLNNYNKLLVEIDQAFAQRHLKTLSDQELIKLKEFCNNIIELCTEQHIKGLGVPYCSALFHFYFPNLIPVIDRNVLVGLEIIDCKKIPKSGQVFRIDQYYPKLIEKMHQKVREGDVTLREADRNVFFEGQQVWKQYKRQLA